MASFVVYDLIFLAVFILGVVLFLYKRRSNIHKQGLLVLYKTQVGIKFIDWLAKKHAKILKPMQYVVLFSGYTLLISVLYLLGSFVYNYIRSPFLAETIKAPPILPLFPYFTELFNLDSFFPPFYFTYFLVVIAIVAVSHEFAHGIFARLNNIKIHSTGFAFLGPFIGAFVEQDEKQMNKAKKFPQLSILAAGTFANVLMTILFGIILWILFSLSFTSAGVIFNTYSTEVVEVSGISNIHNVTFGEKTFAEFTYNNKTYFSDPSLLPYALENSEFALAYDSSPAFNAMLPNIIAEINGDKIDSYEKLRNSIISHRPGDSILIKALDKGEEKEYNITLGERDGKAFLGIGVIPQQGRGLIGFVNSFITKIKNPNIYYQSDFGNFGIFIYNLLWWIVIINIAVALFNMVPAGIFDGGRFFYLTIWGITRSRKAGEKAYKISTMILLIVLAMVMTRWIFSFF